MDVAAAPEGGGGGAVASRDAGLNMLTARPVELVTLTKSLIWSNLAGRLRSGERPLTAHSCLSASHREAATVAPHLPFAMPVGISSVGWIAELRQSRDERLGRAIPDLPALTVERGNRPKPSFASRPGHIYRIIRGMQPRSCCTGDNGCQCAHERNRPSPECPVPSIHRCALARHVSRAKDQRWLDYIDTVIA